MKSIRQCVKERGDFWRNTAPAAFQNGRDPRPDRLDPRIMGSSVMRKIHLYEETK